MPHVKKILGFKRASNQHIHKPNRVIVDAPHGGRIIPADMKSVLFDYILNWCTDHHTDDLVKGLERYGADVLWSKISRLYIDPNRHINDILPKDFQDGAQFPLKPLNSPSAQKGKGLIWQRIYDQDQKKELSIYDPPLMMADWQWRVAHYWMPYHLALQGLLMQKKQKFGEAIHLNIHSCPRYEIRTRKKLADITLGDHFGRSANPELIQQIKHLIEDAGYSVAINKPYSGNALTSLYSDPSNGIQSVQIEIVKDLYMDEATGVVNQVGMKRLKRMLGDLVLKLG